MLILISPAKSLNLEAKVKVEKFTIPAFLKDSQELIRELRKLDKSKISSLMKISGKLAELNFERYHNFSTPFNHNNAKPALFTFDGDVYSAIEAEKYNEEQLDYAQKNLRILSGLYGILRPLDLIQPYRLEMSTKLKNNRGKDLYQFWGDRISSNLAQEGQEVIINLASEEYSKVVKSSNLTNVTFKENKNGEYKIVGIHAKRARGMMVDYMIKNNIDTIEGVKNFKSANYRFQKGLSSKNELIFHRK